MHLPAVSILSRAEYELAAKPYQVSPEERTVLHSDWTKGLNGHAYIQKREVKRLQKILALGLHPCYTDFDEFLCDFYPDFSWNSKDCNAELRMLLSDPEWMGLALQVLEARGMNFVSELQRALEQPEEE